LGQTWVEDTFKDFNDGQFYAAGQNLYATRHGQVKTIHRFDLNSDGYLDLVFNSSHDFIQRPPATCYMLPSGRAKGKAGELPVGGSTHAAVADLNKDGFLDAVFCPNNDWVSARRYALILWGDKRGWSARRMTNLLTISPQALQIADLNGDTWPDIIVLNGSRWAPEDGPGVMLRIYWGSPEGFRQEHVKEVVLDRGSDLKAQDLDGDDRPELVVLQSSPAEVLVYWNDRIGPGENLPQPARIDLKSRAVSRLAIADYNGDGRMDIIASGGVREVVGRDPTTGEERYRYSGFLCVPAGQQPRSWSEPQAVSGPPASSMTVADVNEDGYVDILLADRGAKDNSIHILWGDPDGHFAAQQSTALPVSYGSALDTADLDGDGHLDVVVGVAKTRTGETYDASSRVFYGDGEGGFTLADLQIPTAAGNDVVVAPNDLGDGHRLIFCNNMSGRINEDVPIRVYWGGEDGFTPERLSLYRIRSGFSSSAADLNDDGYADLILASIVHNVGDPHSELGFNILWGDQDGLKDDRRTILREYALTSTNVADFDRDGYLDLLGTCNRPGLEAEPPRIVIWHGGPDGFTPERRFVLPCKAIACSNTVADFNKDGYLDIAVTRTDEHRISVWWGGEQGFSEDRESSWPLAAADDLTAADIDLDGWLDLIVTSYHLRGTLYFDFGTYIFWGGPAGFDPTNAQRLPGHAGYGINVADFDNDGHLDLFVNNYRFTNNRQAIPSYLFWGSNDGFSDVNRTDITVDSGSGGMAADFNGDGLIDLAVSCHTRNGNHFTNSRVYYNDGHRFVQPRFVELPTVGSHYMHRADMGNIYDRTYRQTYISSVFKWEGKCRRATLSYVAETPGNSRLQFAVRSASSEEQLARRPWLELDRMDSNSPEQAFAIRPSDRCIQYRATFISDNGERYPVLDRVAVGLSK